jgi:oligo-alginate lyase
MFLGAIALIAGLASVRGTEIGPLPSHPRLLLNAEGVANLKARIAAAPWAAAEWKTLVAQTERELGHDVELPPRGGNWSHNYVCPIHGARLREGKQIGPWQWEHICPVGNHVLHGDPSKAELDFDGNGIAAVHGRLAEQIVNAGLIYQVTGDARYAAKARAILLA